MWKVFRGYGCSAGTGNIVLWAWRDCSSKGEPYGTLRNQPRTWIKCRSARSRASSLSLSGLTSPSFELAILRWLNRALCRVALSAVTATYISSLHCTSALVSWSPRPPKYNTLLPRPHVWSRVSVQMYSSPGNTCFNLLVFGEVDGIAQFVGMLI